METVVTALPFALLLVVASCSSSSTTQSVASPSEGPHASKETQLPTEPQSLGDFRVRTLEGEPVSLDAWRGKVVLVVNTASQCGYTPQYAGLEALHDELGPEGFEVLGFPCNEFGGQEPGDAGEIRSFCTDRFEVTFPMFEKVNVKAGEGQAPLYAWLQKSTGQVPTWNFCKYLVGRDGKAIGFWSSKTAPDAPELREAIDTALAAK